MYIIVSVFIKRTQRKRDNRVLTVYIWEFLKLHFSGLKIVGAKASSYLSVNER